MKRPSPPSVEGHQRESLEDELLSRVDWTAVNRAVRKEVSNRELANPTVSVFRWWARRPHALMAALLDAFPRTDLPPVVSDPFSGGATVAIEAAARGFPFHAQDINPWPVWGLG